MKLIIVMTANQMMKGPNHGRLTASKKQKQLFLKRHEKQIAWVVEQLPRCSAAVPAVLTKCLIKYGRQPVERFCYAVKNGVFEGKNDPAHLFWRYLLKEAGRDTITIYKKTVQATKAYMENKPLDFLRCADSDVFEWDENWTVPDELLANWNPDKEMTLND